MNQSVQKPRRILVLGSGALQIGQAGEFDYSGTQALKAYREEGIETVLLNPNIATVQTDVGMANATYLLPVTPYFVEQVLIQENCDAIALSFGGQSALNCGLALEASGVLARLGVRVLGTSVQTIRDTEDRYLFVQKLREIQVETARSLAVHQVEDAISAARQIGYPVMMRAGFALGGKGSSIVHNDEECRKIAEIAFANVPQILVEECLSGWKEIEYEVVRDQADNCITVCNMENIDPMGVHTGESIVIAPSQTLDDQEYQMLRSVAIKTIRHLGIIGECNIQYALNPKSRQYRVIEVNARLSRSSALASKATGYPLAYVAAKLGLGYTLPEIPNAMTKVTTAFFEPALDYIVCKYPRWDLEKFDGADLQIGTEMKSVGEVMAIGRSLPEVLQKAIRMLEIGADGLDPHRYVFDDLRVALREPNCRRLFAVAQAFYVGMGVPEVAELTQMDPFFLYEIERAIHIRQSLTGMKAEKLTTEMWRYIKRAGFSDKCIAKLTQTTETNIRRLRQEANVRPYLAQIDTLAAEYPAHTNFLYLTYAARSADLEPCSRASVLVLGSGCYRIGSSVEFDWCGVSAVRALKEQGYEPILLNCNPETVSTDFDTCERLIFDEISLETVLELVDFENPQGVMVSMGGQTANNLALGLAETGVHLMGTSAQSIHIAESRHLFSDLLDQLEIRQPAWCVGTDVAALENDVQSIGGFPIVVRPSYVLSGAAMRIATHQNELERYLQNAQAVSPLHPVVLSKFAENAMEVEIDAVAWQGDIVLWAMTEHIENAGVHSGDATVVIPPQRLFENTIHEAYAIASRLAKALSITGPFNLQMLCQEQRLSVIELNLRASRSFPFISKAMGVNFAQEAVRCMLGVPSVKHQISCLELPYVVVKAPQFSFGRIRGADPRLRIEMASTGEVACFGASVEEALLKAYLSTGFKVPQKGILLHTSSQQQALDMLESLLPFIEKQVTFYVLAQQAESLRSTLKPLHELATVEEAQPLLHHQQIDWVISLTNHGDELPSSVGRQLRRAAVDYNVHVTTDLWLAKRLCRAATSCLVKDLQLLPLSHYLNHEDSLNNSPNTINQQVEMI